MKEYQDGKIRRAGFHVFDPFSAQPQGLFHDPSSRFQIAAIPQQAAANEGQNDQHRRTPRTEKPKRGTLQAHSGRYFPVIRT